MVLLQNLKQALRGLRRTPGFTAVALLTLALSIGASTAVFSVLQVLFLKPLPFAEPERLVYIYTADPNRHFPNQGYLPLSAAAYRDVQQRQRVFLDVAAYQVMSATLTGQGDAERISGLRVTGSFFQVLGTQAALGRTLQSTDDHGPKVVVLAHSLWAGHFGSDPSILGRSVNLDGTGYMVVGVMPATFAWQEQPQLFVSGPPSPEEMQEARGTLAFEAIGRLQDSFSQAQATAAMDKLGDELGAEFPDAREWGIGATRLWEYLYGNRRATSGLLLLTGAFVLLIAIANLANLMISRAAGRQRELAIRRAIGGVWLDSLRPFLADGLVLSLVGGSLGLLLAWGLSGLLRSYVPPELLGSYGLDLRVLGFTLAVSVMVALVAGLVPAFLFSRTGLSASLRQGNRGTSGRSQDWLRKILVTVQVALTLALLVSFSALWRSLHELQQAPLGYEAEGALAFTVRPSPQKYPEDAQQTVLMRQIVSGISELPGVKAVGSVSATPMGSSNMYSGDFIIPGRQDENLSASYRSISPGGFDALGVTLLQGRGFVDADCVDRPENVIVSRSLADSCWPGQDPIGKSIFKYMYDDAGTTFRIVGVVEDVRHQGPAVDRGLEAIYWPAHGIGWGSSNRIVVRANGNPMALVPALRTFLKRVDPDLPLTGIQTLRSVVEGRLDASKTQASLLGILAGIALSLAAAGIYGVMAYTVSQRTREIGIRKALGGQNWQVVWGIARRGFVLMMVGLGIGVILSFEVAHVLASQVYGVSATDPMIIGLASLAFALVGFAASLIPASRAARMNPVHVLRSE